MVSIEIISIVLLAILCFLSSRSDLKEGIIRNKTLLVFFVLGIAFDLVYYGFYERDLLVDFIINFLIVLLISLVLFYSHTFAGGDCKLMIVLAMLYPAKCYLTVWDYNYSLVLVFVLAFVVSYGYLLFGSLWSIALKKTKISFSSVKNSLLSFLKAYLSALALILFFGCIVSILEQSGINIHFMVIGGICVAIALCVGKFAILRKLPVFIAVVMSDFAISLATQVVPVTFNIENCFLVLFLCVCQIVIKTNIYETVEIKELKKGMILSSLSSIPMQLSITKGLPGISTEDLRSRLSEDEIESIKIWARATKTDTITIVKTIPFAVFIALGFFAYLFMWGITL